LGHGKRTQTLKKNQENKCFEESFLPIHEEIVFCQNSAL